MHREVLCTVCHTDNEPGEDRCRACGREVAVDPEVKQQRERERKAAEIERLRAKVKERQEREAREASLAAADSMTDDELDALREAAGEKKTEAAAGEAA